MRPSGRSRNGTTSGGCGTMIRFPSCTTVSLAAAWAAVAAGRRAAVLAASARITGSWMPAMTLSAFICVYQVVSVSISGEPAHEVAVGAGARERDGARLLPPEAVAASGDDEAGDEPLDVPLERTRQRLVEVVDVEDERALRRAVQAEVEQVGVPAQLHLEVGARARGEVGGHDRGSAAVEAERVLQHARVADGQERLEPVGLLGGDDRDRVGAIRLGLPRAERLERHGRPLRLAGGLRAPRGRDASAPEGAAAMRRLRAR